MVSRIGTIWFREESGNRFQSRLGGGLSCFWIFLQLMRSGVSESVCSVSVLL